MERRLYEDRVGGAVPPVGGAHALPPVPPTSQPPATTIIMQGPQRMVGTNGALNGPGALRVPGHYDAYSWQQNLGIQASLDRTSDTYDAHPMYYATDVFSTVTLEGGPQGVGKGLLDHEPNQPQPNMKPLLNPDPNLHKTTLLHDIATTSTTSYHMHHPPHHTHHHAPQQQQLQQQQQLLVPGIVVTGGNGSGNTSNGVNIVPLNTNNQPQQPATVVNNNHQVPGSGGVDGVVKKKKKKIVKSKKKMIKNDEDADTMDCSVYPDDLVYIRTAPPGSRHAVAAQAQDAKAMRLLCPRLRPPPADDTDDEFSALAGVGVWEYGKVWNHHLTIKFLECLHKNKKRMFSRDSRRLLYMELSSMFQSEDHAEITTEELEKKWCSLLSSYKRNQNRLRGGEEVTWSYYRIMDDIMVEGRCIRRQNRERPKRPGRLRLSQDEADLRGVRGACRRRNKKLKQALLERLEEVKSQRERGLGETRACWDTVKETISNINSNLTMLNSSVVMLGHTMDTLLGAIEKLDKIDKIKKEGAL